MALRVTNGAVDLALGIARALTAEHQLAAVLAALHEDATLEAAMAARTEGRLAGVACTRDAARAVASG